MRNRIFLSPYNDARYVAGRPLSVKQFLELPKKEQDRLKQLAD